MDYEAIYKRQHDYIGAADDHARGYYLGLCKMLCYSQGVVNHGTYSVAIPLDDAGYGYSPSGTQQHAAHFYSPEPVATPDLVRHSFDPVLFHCIMSELDSEGGILAWRVELTGEEILPAKGMMAAMRWSYINISIACSEDDYGIPDNWEYQDWAELEALRDRIREVEVGGGDASS